MASPAAIASYLESVDPASGEVIARFEATPPVEVPRILEQARAAQQSWKRLRLQERCAFIGKLKDVFYQRRNEIADVVTREVGKPRVESLFSDVLISLDAAAYYADFKRVQKLLKSERVPHHNLAMKAKSGRIQYEPRGVIGIISPWNFPITIPIGQILPALVAGNAVVLKPSELTPWCGALIGEMCGQAGFPTGLVQVIQGRGDLGAALVEPGGPTAPPDSPSCDKIIFTGSVATGRRVGEACARRLVPCVLELGGKDAMVVLADAELEIASSGAVWGSFTNCGQACLSVERLYVERSVADRFTELCVAKAKRLRVGPGSDPETEVGPMITRQQVERVERQLEDAVARGARILLGGRRSSRGGCYFEPTVMTGVNHSMLLMQEETFGPVLAIYPVEDATEAVRLANDSKFGLSASVWTRDSKRGEQIAAQLNAGTVMVNDVISAFGVCEAPHGGRGASGWGHTHSRLGLLEMVQVKYVDVDRLPRVPKSWWYGYNADLGAAAERFLEFLFAPKASEKFRKVRGALGAVFRKGRI